MQVLRADYALLPSGVARDVQIHVQDRQIVAVATGGAHAVNEIAIDGLVLPGMANVHSHAFQRAMAGLAEWDAGGRDNFWSWREAMYRFAERLDPQSQLAIARFLYVEMLKAGYTAVGEFHYLHNRPGGAPYAPAASMMEAIAQAAQETGIALTLLPTLYMQGGVDGRALNERQKRFGKSVSELLDMRTAMRDKTGVAQIGLALHSLRAVPPPAMREAIQSVEPTSPLHIHAAEQTGEIEEAQATLNARPVEWLLNEMHADQRWCLVHSTHINDAETASLAKSGAAAGLCPTTEGNLGDGIFPLEAYLASHGRLAIGGDSHVSVDPAEELKALEYSQRLTLRRRNVGASASEAHTAARLWSLAALGGAQALGLGAGAIVAGARADLVVIDTDHISLAGREDTALLDSYIFVAGKSAVRDVMVGGTWVVGDGRHALELEAAAAYRAAVTRILSD
ncbi:MAG: formimidoylglutamate deiminase [Alphaproteobacteria bacterium]|nr:formimidoylglutamate deiminase [Alphaproteobacteria bacterium]